MSEKPITIHAKLGAPPQADQAYSEAGRTASHDALGTRSAAWGLGRNPIHWDLVRENPATHDAIGTRSMVFLCCVVCLPVCLSVFVSLYALAAVCLLACLRVCLSNRLSYGNAESSDKQRP